MPQILLERNRLRRDDFWDMFDSITNFFAESIKEQWCEKQGMPSILKPIFLSSGYVIVNPAQWQELRTWLLEQKWFLDENAMPAIADTLLAGELS